MNLPFESSFMFNSATDVISTQFESIVLADVGIQFQVNVSKEGDGAFPAGWSRAVEGGSSPGRKGSFKKGRPSYRTCHTPEHLVIRGGEAVFHPLIKKVASIKSFVAIAILHLCRSKRMLPRGQIYRASFRLRQKVAQHCLETYHSFDDYEIPCSILLQTVD